MKNLNSFGMSGKWFKGNLHLHSTNSDGRLSPEEAAKRYKEKGWNFIAFTEHRTANGSGALRGTNQLSSIRICIIKSIREVRRSERASFTNPNYRVPYRM